MAKDALGEVFTEKRAGRLIQVRRIIVSESSVTDILAEVMAAMTLTSPAILKPLDAKADGGLVTIEIETIDAARSLRGLLTTLATNGEKLPVSTATWITMRVLEALQHAHQHTEAGNLQPIYHCRLSPEHVILTPNGDVRVTGFGLDAAAKLLLKPQLKTDPAFAYVAPEQINNGEITPATDTFAAGAVLAEALLGKPLFLEDTFAQTWDAIGGRLPPQIRETRDNVPKALDEALAWAMEKNPDRRARGPEVLRTRLEAFQGMLDVGDRIKPDEHPKRIADLIRLRKPPPAALDVTSMEPVKTAEKKERPRGRRPVLMALRFTFLVMVVGFGAGVYENWRDLEDPIRAKIPPFIAAQLGIDQAPVPPPVEHPDAGSEAIDAGVADAGVADAGTPARPGTLIVESTPSKANVTLDGKPVGVTPLSGLSVPAGEHTIVVSSRKPKIEASQTVTVAEGETRKLKLKLKRK